jgi:hypothetical protein
VIRLDLGERGEDVIFEMFFVEEESINDNKFNEDFCKTDKIL